MSALDVHQIREMDAKTITTKCGKVAYRKQGRNCSAWGSDVTCLKCKRASKVSKQVAPPVPHQQTEMEWG